MLSGSSSHALGLWWRQRGASQVLLVHAVGLGVLVVSAGRLVHVPSLVFSAGLEVPNAAVIPLVSALAFGWGISRRRWELERGTRRKVLRWDVALGLAITLSYPALIGAIGFDLALVATRNALGLLGLVMLISGLFPGMGNGGPATIVAGFVLLCLLAGSTSPMRAPWFWLVKVSHDPLAAIIACFTFAAGAMAQLTLDRRAAIVRSADENL